MRSERTRIIVEIGLAAALGGVFHVLSVTLPINIAGGEVSLTMLPIVVVALRRGLLPGVACGVLVGIVGLLYKPYVVHPAQVVLDYPIAFGAVGLAGLFRAQVQQAAAAGQQGLCTGLSATAAVVGAVARFGAHFVSGVIFFAANAPEGQPVWIYSAVYNATYMLPSAILCAAAAALLVPVLERAVPPGHPVGA